MTGNDRPQSPPMAFELRWYGSVKGNKTSRGVKDDCEVVSQRIFIKLISKKS